MLIYTLIGICSGTLPGLGIVAMALLGLAMAIAAIGLASCRGPQMTTQNRDLVFSLVWIIAIDLSFGLW